MLSTLYTGKNLAPNLACHTIMALLSCLSWTSLIVIWRHTNGSDRLYGNVQPIRMRDFSKMFSQATIVSKTAKNKTHVDVLFLVC